MAKPVMSHSQSARNALTLRVAVSLGIGLLLIAPSGCGSKQPVADTPKVELAPPVVSAAGMAQYKAWRTKQVAIQQTFFQTHVAPTAAQTAPPPPGTTP